MIRSSRIYKFLKRIEKPDNKVTFILNYWSCIALSFYGSILYDRITKLYPRKTVILFPSCCAGDFLYLKYGLDSTTKLFGIDNYILVIDNLSCSGAAKALGITDYFSVNRIKLKAMTVFHRTDNLRKDLLDCYPWVFFDHNKVKIDGYIKKSILSQGLNDNNSAYKEVGVINNKTVILCPYENSISSLNLPVLPREFWNDLAMRLEEIGYTVFTNCSGKNNETPIGDTIMIYPSLTGASALIEYAGFCIMIRSGFCDYVADSNAKKIVLFPNDEYLRNWSLYNNGKVFDCIELIYEDYMSELNILIEDIVGLLPSCN